MIRPRLLLMALALLAGCMRLEGRQKDGKWILWRNGYTQRNHCEAEAERLQLMYPQNEWRCLP